MFMSVKTVGLEIQTQIFASSIALNLIMVILLEIELVFLIAKLKDIFL